MKTIKEILEERQLKKRRYVTREFQEFGVRLAEELGDLEHKGLYIKLAKREPRPLLEEALDFVKSGKPKSKAKLFMWRFKKLRECYTKADEKSLP